MATDFLSGLGNPDTSFLSSIEETHKNISHGHVTKIVSYLMTKYDISYIHIIGETPEFNDGEPCEHGTSVGFISAKGVSLDDFEQYTLEGIKISPDDVPSWGDRKAWDAYSIERYGASRVSNIRDKMPDLETELYGKLNVKNKYGETFRTGSYVTDILHTILGTNWLIVAYGPDNIRILPWVPTR